MPSHAINSASSGRTRSARRTGLTRTSSAAESTWAFEAPEELESEGGGDSPRV